MCGAQVLDFLRWVLAFFRLQQRSTGCDDPTAVHVPLEPEAEGATTPTHLLQSAQELGWASAQSPPKRENWSHEHGDHHGGMVPAVPAPFFSTEFVDTVEPAQDEPAPISANLLGSDDDRLVVVNAVGIEKVGLVTESDAYPALVAENGGTSASGDQHEPSAHAPSDDSSEPRVSDWPIFPSLEGSGDHAILEDPELFVTSDASTEGTGVEGAVNAWTPVAHHSYTPTDQLSHADACADPIVEEVVACTDAAIAAECPVERETVGACDGGAFGTGSVDEPGETTEPEKRREVAGEQTAADLSTDEADQEPGDAAEAKAHNPESARLLDAEAAGEVGEALTNSEPRIDGDVAIYHASGAAALSPMKVDYAEKDHVEVDQSLLSDPAAQVGADGTSFTDGVAAAFMRRPGEYKPRLKRTRTRRAPSSSAAVGGDTQHLSADLLLLIGAADWGVQLSALLRTPEGAADEVAVDQDGVVSWLGQLDDQFLEPLALTDARAAFGEPLFVSAVDLPVSWSRTSRDLHVLGSHAHVAGFASQARVVIGQESVVICREGLADAARAQILATGSAEPIPIEGPNVPSGWVCWRGVRPVRPSVPANGPAILDALDPLPAVSIELCGGIRLSRGAWLEGHPPSIRLLGLLSETDPVLIDSSPALADGEGGWTAEGWDAPGSHTIHHGGKSASYTIQPGVCNWDWWAGWEGATRLAGALSYADGCEYFHHTGAVALLGARPGQISKFVPVAFGIGVARPDFEPVWLLTVGSGSRRNRASLVGSNIRPGMPVGSREAVERWVRLVSSSNRAGAERSEERTAWNDYVAVARSYRKRRR